MSEKKLSVCQRKKQELFGRLSALEVFKEKYNASEEQQQIAVRKEWLEETREEFLKTMEKIKDLDTTIDIQKGIEEEADFMSRYFNIKGFLLSQMGSDTAIMNASALNTTICNAGQSNNLHLRLPKIELPVFDGDATKWLTFRDRFTAMIHVSSEIPAVMKLQYLVASLRGEAAARFEHTSITADNYIITWNALLKRYDNKRSLIREYIRALHMMPSMRSECVDSLVQLVDDFIRHVKGLEKLNEPVDQWDTPLCALLFLKLDDASLLAWENHSVLHATTSTKDKYAELLEFLQDRIRILKSRIRPSSSSSVHVRAKVAGETTGRSENGRNRSSRAVAVPVQNHAEATLVSVKCLLCGSNHTIYKCSLFEAMNIQERYNTATSKKLCFNCLLSGHTVQACRSKFTCKSCHKRHHSMLCNVKERTFDDHRKSATLTCHSKNQSLTTNASKFVFLSTVQLWVSDQNGRRILARGLLDSGSQTNFMSERLAQQLQLSRTSANVPVAGIGEVATTVRHKVSAKLSSQHTAFEIALSFLVIKRPTIDLPAVDVDTSRWLIPENIQLADPTFSKVGRIDFILGAEVFFDLMLDGKVSLASNLPTLINTKFGWILSGSCYPKHQTSIAACASSIICKEEENINALMEAFFRVEEVQDQDVMSAEERECEQQFQATTTRDPDGKYIVRLPFKDDPTSALGDSKTTAERRFLAVERRLNREPQTKEAYIAFMKEYEQLGHIQMFDSSYSVGFQFKTVYSTVNLIT